jgi:glycine C-acetyltransferase
VDHFGLHGRVDVEVGTLSKAFGVVGGFISGTAELIDYLRQKARPNLFSSALTVPDVAANLASVEILEESDDLVRKLWSNGKLFKERMKGYGFNIGQSQTPITPVILGEAAVARSFSARLFEEGIFAQAIAFPTVPKGTARIRVMVSAAHEPEDLEMAADVFARVAGEMNLLPNRRNP